MSCPAVDGKQSGGPASDRQASPSSALVLSEALRGTIVPPLTA